VAEVEDLFLLLTVVAEVLVEEDLTMEEETVVELSK
jgi:hypothetical protein